MTGIERAIRVARASRVPVACVGLAALSLLLPWDLSFDPWGWVAWGREITSPHAIFSTETYPSWKPLPVLFTAAFSPLNDAAPELWLVVARAGAIFAVLLAYRLAAPLGGRTAGVAAAAGLVLVPDWLRYFAGGASEPLLVALVLGAVDRHLAGRRGQALGLGAAAALLRPEVWPFIVGYLVAYSWRRPRRVVAGVVLGLAVAALWFIPEWIGAGNPFHGGRLAQLSREAQQAHRLHHPQLDVFWRAITLVVAPLALAGLVAVVRAARRREPVTLALAGGALAWIAVVGAMAGFGYAGLGRFALPAAALICVLGGAGLAQLLELGSGSRRAAIAAVAVLVSAPFVVGRVERMPAVSRANTARDRLEDQLPVVVDGLGGRTRVLSCRRFAVLGPYATTLAWRLGVPITAVRATPPWLILRAHHLRGVRPLRRSTLRRRIARIAGWDVFAGNSPPNCQPRRSVGEDPRQGEGALAQRDG
jgi:hypothetical protein